MRLFRLPFYLVAALIVLSVWGASAQTDPYANVPQSQSLEGFANLGYPSALVNVVIYAAFDDPASAEFWLNAYRGLLPRVQNGEIRLIFVPLVGQGIIAARPHFEDSSAADRRAASS